MLTACAAVEEEIKKDEPVIEKAFEVIVEHEFEKLIP
jgi:hypothetical protein